MNEVESEDGRRRQKKNLHQENENIVSDARHERELWAVVCPEGKRECKGRCEL